MWVQGVNDYECMCNVLKDGMHVNGFGRKVISGDDK